jgi:hypothetical protein
MRIISKNPGLVNPDSEVKWTLIHEEKPVLGVRRRIADLASSKKADQTACYPVALTGISLTRECSILSP